MKKLKHYLPILLIPIFAACGGAESSNSENTDDDNSGETAELSSEFADISKLASQGEFTTEEFSRMITFLEGKEVILTGYPYAYPLGKGEEVEFKPNSTEMLDGIDNSVDNCSIRIQFKNETEPRMMHIGDLFAVKGKLSVSYSLSNNDRWPNNTYITVKDAEFVENAEAKGGEVNSFDDLDLKKQVFCGDLYALVHKHFEALSKKSVVVKGTHYGRTVSSSLNGDVTEVRIDLKDGDSKIGCEMADESEAGLAKTKGLSGVLKIEGKFAGIIFGNARIGGGVLK